LVGRIAGPAAGLTHTRDPDTHQRVDVLVGKGIENDGVHDAV
jgi:hypothetical protein